MLRDAALRAAPHHEAVMGSPGDTMQRLAQLPGNILLLIATLAVGTPAHAQPLPYPTRNVEIVVPYGPGGSTDIVARIVAQALQERLGQTFVVLNRPGAGGTIGLTTAMRAPPDGYTLL